MEHCYERERVLPVAKGFGVDLHPYLKLRYRGTQASALYTVAAAGDLTLKHGAASAEAVDPTVGVAGVLDVSTAAYDTVREARIAIENETNWDCLALVPGSWSMNCAGAGALMAVSEEAGDLQTEDGQILYQDSSEANTVVPGTATACYAHAILIGPESVINDGEYEDRRTHPLGEMQSTWDAVLKHFTANHTTSGSSAAQHFWVVEEEEDGTERILYGPVTGAASASAFDWPASGLDGEIKPSKPGNKLFACYGSEAAITAASNSARGETWPRGETDVITYR